jgi:hypothetical protein
MLGETLVDPSGATAPMSWSIVPEVTFCDVHESFAAPPVSIVVGSRIIEHDGAGGSEVVSLLVMVQVLTSRAESEMEPSAAQSPPHCPAV